MLESKRGQITIFVIIAILIVAGIVFFFMVKDKYESNKSDIPLAITPAYNFIIDCIKNTGQNAILDLAKNGGYSIYSGQISTSKGIPYYIKDNQSIMPNLDRISMEFKLYLATHIPECVDKLNHFNITYSIPNTETKIYNEKIIFDIEFPIVIIKNNHTYSLKEFKDISLNTKFGTLINASNQIVISELNHGSGICLSCINEIAQNNNLRVDLVEDQFENATLVTLSDLNSKINNQTLQMVFAVENE
jgi:hypothetical protein